MLPHQTKIVLLYSNSDFTPWHENVSVNLIVTILNALQPYYDISVAHFAGFTTEFASLLKRFDLVFNICYGYNQLQQTDICKWLDDNEINHTSSSYVAQMLAQDKLLLPQLCQQVDFDTPIIYDDASVLELCTPLILKPRFGSMHRDIHVFENGNVPEHYFKHNDYLVQEFIKGREFTAAIIPNIHKNEIVCLYPAEIIPNHYNEYFVLGSNFPKQLNFRPNLSPSLVDEITYKMLQLHKLIGLENISRTDFKIYNDKIYILDVNAMPNIEPEKVFYPEYIEKMDIHMIHSSFL
ncbi:MAG: ATP-grasp domain-containing protein [Sphaerospermopsis sp.]|nr:ATP-grasp domain-containing protein [Sphaerospermopsis sp.]